MNFPWFSRPKQTCEFSEEQYDQQFRTGEEIFTLVKQLLPRMNESVISHFRVTAKPRNGQCYTILLYFNHRRERELVLQVDVHIDGTIRALLGRQRVGPESKAIIITYLKPYLRDWKPRQELTQQ